MDAKLTTETKGNSAIRKTLLALASRCEAATGPDRELDEAIATAIYPGIRRVADRWCLHDVHVRIEGYTASLDAAMTLVPEGWYLDLHDWRWTDDPRWIASLQGITKGERWAGASGCGPAPAVALCAASLRARAALL